MARSTKSQHWGRTLLPVAPAHDCGAHGGGRGFACALGTWAQACPSGAITSHFHSVRSAPYSCRVALNLHKLITLHRHFSSRRKWHPLLENVFNFLRSAFLKMWGKSMEKTRLRTERWLPSLLPPFPPVSRPSRPASAAAAFPHPFINHVAAQGSAGQLVACRDLPKGRRNFPPAFFPLVPEAGPFQELPRQAGGCQVESHAHGNYFLHFCFYK